MSISERPAAAAEAAPAYLRSPEDVIHDLNTDVTSGLSRQEAAARLATHGPNQITAEKPPSAVAIALTQLRDPMNIMLVAVTVVSLVIGQVSTALLVAVLVLLNVVLGTRQELKARASVDALSKLQVPQSRVLRDGAVDAGPCRRRGARRRGAGRGRRHRPGRRPDRRVGHAGDAGGGAHW